jgi:hypothetical protein
MITPFLFLVMALCIASQNDNNMISSNRRNRQSLLLRKHQFSILRADFDFIATPSRASAFIRFWRDKSA